ncbi:MAG TPA: zf-HC2 domain-containing protein [Anaerolineaceae bacterium]|nr:zf-HC2 domain-containing protein [Anaerolineaceae bacterium]
MPDQMSNKLGAYLDGELDRQGQIEMEAHLETCQACRDELEELRRLSLLLRAAPQPDFTPALDFKAQLMLQLPRRAEAQPPRRYGLLLGMAPALVLAVWIFLQVALGLSTLVSLANQAGFLDGSAPWAASNPQQLLWFTAAQATIGGILGLGGQAVLKFFNDAGLFAQSLAIPLLLQIGAAVLYGGALLLVWHYKVEPLWTSSIEG